MRYEAEWAYLPCFQDLGKTPKDVLYAPWKEASGGMKVSFLGGRTENYAEWKEVYSAQGGAYEMTVQYVPQAHRRLEIRVNNDPLQVLEKELQTDALKAKIASVTVPVRLQAGFNRVRMGNPYGWTPDLDGFTLKRVGE